jgi:hypothetical protein
MNKFFKWDGWTFEIVGVSGMYPFRLCSGQVEVRPEYVCIIRTKLKSRVKFHRLHENGKPWAVGSRVVISGNIVHYCLCKRLLKTAQPQVSKPSFFNPATNTS